MPSVIVVGAGAGGITAAARLAKHGFDVTVVEQHGDIGGRCSLIRRNGFRFDQGPSLLLMPEVFHQTFRDLGTSLKEEGVELLSCEPNYNIWFTDNTAFQLSTDLRDVASQVERLEGKEGTQSLLSFLKESGLHYDLSMEHVMSKSFGSPWSMLRPAFVASVFAMHPFESCYSRVSRYFSSERLRRVFTFASMYLGMSPFEAPATYSLLQYTELTHGIRYPAGGFQRVLAALGKVGQRLGVRYRLNSPVSSVIVSNDNVARGVKLRSGEELLADIVLVNADLVYAYNHLLPPSSLATSLAERRASCSSISFFWSFDRVIPQLLAHNIFLADEYRESFDAIFLRQRLPADPSFYVNVPSRVDPSAAPAGKDAVVVLVPVGHIVDDPANPQDWDALVEFARDHVFNTIEARTGIRGLREALIDEAVETPPSWKEKFNLDRGAILGLSHNFFNVLSFRPRMKHDAIRGLYFVGASTHPGTGVPVCLAGGKIVSDKIIRDVQSSSRGWMEDLLSPLRVLMTTAMVLLFSALLRVCGSPA